MLEKIPVEERRESDLSAGIACRISDILSRCWRKVFFLWGNDIAVLTFPPGNGVSLRRKYFSRGEMSQKAPQNLEKMQLKEEISTKRYQNMEEMHPKRKISMK